MRDSSTGLDELRRAFAAPAVPAVAEGARRAAVAAILSPGPAGPDLWFIQRAERDRDPWSGQVAFPGGRVETHDADALAAAVRETHEEIGIALGGGELLGPLDDLAPLTGAPALVVHPFAFWLPDPPEPTLNAHEVAGVFRAPLSTLLVGQGRTRFDLQWRGSNVRLPCVHLPGPMGLDVRLWGMTLRIVDDLLHRIDGRGIGLERPWEGGGTPGGAIR